MDHGSRNFLWLIASALGHCDLRNPRERKELLAISGRLKQLAGKIADELSCKRIEEESAGNRAATHRGARRTPTHQVTSSHN